MKKCFVCCMLLGLFTVLAFTQPSIEVGAAQFDKYLNLLKDKSVALVINQTATVGKTSLLDTLLSQGIKVKAIFAPEHGFRGSADAGEELNNSIDKKTGVPIISLYGAKTKPSKEDLTGINIVLFDIQDVGARFYTFISTLHYLMESCAENKIELIVLDRPNPNGHYVAGPVLETAFRSFVGLDPIPIVHGLTVGEYAQMLNGEHWLENGLECKLTVIPCQNYTHKRKYYLPIKPSPNLPNAKAIAWYPSLCLFEGTNVSVGRGTDKPFQQFGSPECKGDSSYSFIPKPKQGAKNPPFANQKCFGKDLSKEQAKEFTLQFLLAQYQCFADKDRFFLPNHFFDKLAGTDKLRKQIIAGISTDSIEASWQPELKRYKAMRKKYLLYPDFE